MKNFLSNSFIFLLVFFGSLLLGWQLVDEPVMRYLTYTELVPTEFERNLEYATLHADFDIDDITRIGPTGLLPYINEEVSPIGELIIPSVNIHLPLLHGASNVNMSLGAGTLARDGRMGEGNFGLASHWMPQPGLLFASLHLTQIGDMIFLRNSRNVYVYEVFDNFVVDPHRGDVLDYVEGRVLVTLVTCTPDMYRRVIVQGELVEVIPVEDILAANEANTEGTEPTTETSEITEITEIIQTYELVEILTPIEPEFPILEASLIVLGSFLLATLVVSFSNRRSRERL